MQKTQLLKKCCFQNLCNGKHFKRQSVVRSFEGTIAPGRTITPGACQQFRSGSEPADAQSLNFLRKGLTKKAKNGSRGAKNETRRGKNCVFGPKH